MSYILSSTTIKSPTDLDVTNSSQVAQIRTISGAVTRDYFGSNKRQWNLNYKSIEDPDFSTIKSIYDTYVGNSTPVTFSVTDTNYTVSQTTVHVDLSDREFSVHGSNMISDFKLTLTEA